jgi:hypothetical protein
MDDSPRPIDPRGPRFNQAVLTVALLGAFLLDAKALKSAVTTYPDTDDYDLEEALTQLGTGEAMVTILSERGAPTPVVWTKLLPPRSLMAAIGADELEAAAHGSDLWPKYAQEVDRDSAAEKLAGRMAESAAADAADEADALAPGPELVQAAMTGASAAAAPTVAMRSSSWRRVMRCSVM